MLRERKRIAGHLPQDLVRDAMVLTDADLAEKAGRDPPGRDLGRRSKVVRTPLARVEAPAFPGEDPDLGHDDGTALDREAVSDTPVIPEVHRKPDVIDGQGAQVGEAVEATQRPEPRLRDAERPGHSAIDRAHVINEGDVRFLGASGHDHTLSLV